MSPTPRISHERCSELLLPHLGGELAPEDAAAVERHLAGCESCARERSGITTLLATSGGNLSEEERSRLRAALDPGALRHEALPTPGAPTRRRRRSPWERLAPVLGAAALAVVVAGGGYMVFSGSTGGPSGETTGSAGENSGGSERRLEQATKEAAPSRKPRQEQDSNDSADSRRSGSGFAARALEPGPPPEPVFEARHASVTRRSLRKLADKAPFDAYSMAYSGTEAGELAGPFLHRLAELAAARRSGGGEPGLRSAQIEACGRAVLRDRRGAVPAYATFASFDGRAAVILGFGYPSRTGGALDSFILAVWERSSGAASIAPSCARPLAFESGATR